MKKTKQIFKSVILWGLLIVCAVALWDGVFSCYIPWTRTWFPDHQAYLNMLVDEQCYGQSYFIQEIPDDSPEVQYYWHRDIKTKQAAHAMVLSEESYEEIVSRQIGSHTQDCGNMTSLVYEAWDGEFCYIDDSEWYEQNLKYIDEILQDPEAEQQYYFKSVIKINTMRGKCYIGIVVNDTTREMIEFSVELMELETI